MFNTIMSFLVMLNPFALFLYLHPIMKELSHKDFLKVLARASIISFIIFLVFFIAGNFIFRKVFLISFESFKIFGGIVIFSFAYIYIVKGQKALIQMKGSLDDLASEIALPFMIGAGTISLSIIAGNNFVFFKGLFILSLVTLVNYIIIISLKNFRDQLKKRKLQVAFDKNMEILLRLMGFLIGAIGIDMIVTGIKNLML